MPPPNCSRNYKLKILSLSSFDNPFYKFSIVKVHTSLSCSYNCSNDTDSGERRPDVRWGKKSHCTTFTSASVRLYLQAKWSSSSNTTLSCSRAVLLSPKREHCHMHFTNVLASAYTIQYFSLLFTYSLHTFHTLTPAHAALSSRFSPTHARTPSTSLRKGKFRKGS